MGNGHWASVGPLGKQARCTETTEHHDSWVIRRQQVGYYTAGLATNVGPVTYWPKPHFPHAADKIFFFQFYWKMDLNYYKLFDYFPRIFLIFHFMLVLNKKVTLNEK